MRVRLKKSGRGSSSRGSSGMNRSADVSNIICLTACVFGFKKGGGVEGGRSPPAGGVGGGGICKLLTFIDPFHKGGLRGLKRGA